MINATTLRTRIYLGFAVILLLLLVNAFIGVLGAKRLRDANDEMHRVALLNAEVLAIAHKVQELRLRVHRYIANGYDSLRTDVMLLNAELPDQIAHAKAGQTDPEVGRIFGQMHGLLSEYARQFEFVVEERELRTNLVQRNLPARSQAITGTLTALKEDLAKDSAHDDARMALFRCESSFASAEKRLFRYYGNPDSVLVDEAISYLGTAQAQLRPALAIPGSAALAAQLLDDLKEYQKVGMRAVQATRSYLYLVNVVMAGDASEVNYYSARLRTKSKERQEAITEKLASISASVNRVIAAGIALALVLAALIAGRLAYMIVQPITVLTETFQHLAAGETIVTIPETERRDEIGEMAKAARVFSDQNRNTRELLAKAEALSSNLQRQAEELAASNADLDSFAYVASHDLRSPLRGIKQLAAWIEEDAGDALPEDVLKHLATLKQRVQKMDTLLQDLLEYSRIGRVDTKPEEIDINAMVPGIVELIDNPNAVTLSWPEDLPRIYTVRVALEQVLLNLIGNAVKYNHREKGGSVALLWERRDEWYYFTVKDNGPGIDPIHHDRVFQMYQRVGVSETEGSGMGLAIVKRRVESFGGAITLNSALGEGTAIRFSWPVDSESLVSDAS